jgi:hypothetical protein
MIAALFVERGGVYFGLPDVDPWDETRDARLYDGPWPVVAHPPCGPWGALSHRSKETTADCAPIAMAAVRRWGGVLEHPVGSRLFDSMGCPRPGELPDAHGGRTFGLEQVAWGHPCRKPTRIYVVGASWKIVVRGLRVGGEPTHQICGSRMSGHRHRIDLKAASARIRKRTPIAFRDYLLDIARSVPS